MHIDAAGVVCNNDLFDVCEHLAVTLQSIARLCEVVHPKNHVLRRNGDRLAVLRVHDVVRGKDEEQRLELCFVTQWHVNGHLVTVEVSIESRCYQWVQLDGLTLDKLRLEGLDTKAVKSWSTVEEHRMPVDDGIEDVPHFRCLLLYLLLGALHRLAMSALNELADHKWLKEFNGHVLWKSAFVELELRTHNDNRTTRVVDSLTEKVLTEATRFTLERICKRLESTLRLTAHSAA